MPVETLIFVVLQIKNKSRHRSHRSSLAVALSISYYRCISSSRRNAKTPPTPSPLTTGWIPRRRRLKN
ncbi:uncharacterized protein DMAD_01426 [Drosophila madeirensis]|uniref:Uncharacterized protein n=1 Tax=Drosophila madeirensis TaxID=30013 RepID=A0AAU9G013_DROMD